MAKLKILSTKKLDPSVLEQARQNNMEIIEKEYISVRPLNPDGKRKKVQELAAGGIEYVVFTSAHAVQLVDLYLEYKKEESKGWNIFSLSGKTLQAVEQSNNISGSVVATAANADALSIKIIEQNVKQIIFFCGRQRRAELPDALTKAGILLQEIPLYETVEMSGRHEEELDGILFFSPSAVQSFFAANELKKDTVCFAIGSTTADTIGSYTSNPVMAADQPSQESLLLLVESYFKNSNAKK